MNNYNSYYPAYDSMYASYDNQRQWCNRCEVNDIYYTNELKHLRETYREKIEKLKLDVAHYKNLYMLTQLSQPASKEENIPTYITKVNRHIPYKAYKRPYISTYSDDRLKSIINNIHDINDIISLKNISDIHTYKDVPKINKLLNIVPILNKLNNMIGLDDIKKAMFTQICNMLHGDKLNTMYNTVITGDPGVGKTQVGTIIAELLIHLNIASKPLISKPKRNNLIGEYLGHTAVKTQDVIDNSKGGILLIDEAYALGDTRDVFTTECLNLLNQNMTELGSELIVIIIGYKTSLETNFFNINEGLRRRFQTTYNIISPTCDNLKDIFIKMVNDSKWVLDKSISDKDITQLIENNRDMFPYSGGDIETWLSKCKLCNAINAMNSSITINDNIRMLSLADIKNGLNDYIGSRDTSTLINGMYI